MTENKAEHQSLKPSIIEYCIFSRGDVNIPFDSRHYTHEGAIQRCRSLSKVFTGLTLVARKDGVKYRLYPTPDDEKAMAQERARNFRSYQFQRKMTH